MIKKNKRKQIGRKKEKTEISSVVNIWRYRGVKCLIAITALVIVSRLFYLQVIHRHFLQSQGNQRSVRLINIPAHRGIIFDRNGHALAVSTPVTSIWANPSELMEEKGRWSELAELLDISYKSLAKRLKANATLSFMYLKRQMVPKAAQKILDKQIPGVHGIREYRRYYPAGAVTAQLVGMTNIDDKGQSGIELTYNHWLSGKSGKERVIRDLYGHSIDKAKIVNSAEPGKPVYLSIDLRLQYLAYRELVHALSRHEASSGTIVMMDARTGEVLAMVNAPSFNPNNRKDYTPSAARNRAVTDQYEPGSTIKAFTVTAALESGLFTPSTPIDTSPGWMMVDGYTIKDDLDLGKLDVTGVLTKSSNIGASKMAFAIGQQALVKVLGEFGFGQSTGIAFPGEALGYVPFGKKLSKVGLSNLSFGYHISVTPLQLTRAYTALADGGVLYPASLLKLNHSPEGQRIVSQSTASKVVNMLKTVVTKGTGRKAQVAGYTVAGKTGTSHKVGESGYRKDSYYSSFIGMVPADNPRIVMLVMLNNVKKGSYFGGSSAGPVFSKVAGEALRILGVPPDL